jgi:hypothetical protein
MKRINFKTLLFVYQVVVRAQYEDEMQEAIFIKLIIITREFNMRISA